MQAGGRPDACLVALDRATGKEVWRALSDRPGYASPVILDTQEGRRLYYFTPQHVAALLPETGRVAWKVPFEGITYDVAITDVVHGGGVLLAGNYWSGSKGIRVGGKEPAVAWGGTQLSLLMSTPLVRGKYAYALDRFRAAGLTHAKIETLVQNEVGKGLYESLGFREVARQIHFAMEL